MDQALALAHEELEQMLQIVATSFTSVREMLRRSTNPRRNDLQRRINEVNGEFVRLRANRMRHSFERNLARQEADRRRIRTDSDSSIDSNDSDMDLDSIYPLDLCFDEPTTDKAESEKANTATTSEPNPTANEPSTSTTSVSPPPSNNSSSPQKRTTRKPKKIVKRKMQFSVEEAPPAKRSMATSTDDAFFHNLF